MGGLNPARNDRLILLVLLGLGLVLSFAGLGSFRAPQRFFEPSPEGTVVVADLGSTQLIDRLCAYVGLGTGSYLLELSADGTDWSHPLRIEQADEWGGIEWRAASLGALARWVRITAEEPGLEIGEIAIFGPDKRLLTPVSLAPGALIASLHPLFDEQFSATYTPSHRTGTYFDEIYFAHAAIELARGQDSPETTHPPLGKLLIAAGVVVFGATPFGWRFMPALAGALSVPLLFMLARRLLGRTDLALAAALLFLLDFMRFVESRISTVDAFVLLFALASFACLSAEWSPEPPHARFPTNLFLAGLFLGAGAACKWNAAYAWPGMFAIFLLIAWRRRDEAWRLLPAGLLCLVAVPVAVYVASYVPWMLQQGKSLSDVLGHQGEMFRYHSTLSAVHPYASQWWQWPAMIRPVWLYEGRADVPAGMIASIVSMGNPAIWWLGIPCVLVAVIRGPRDKAAAFSAIAFFSLYLPWALAPRRLTFLYHYLPCVPFLILALVQVLGRLSARGPWARALPWILVAAAGALFAAFVPILAGLPIPLAWAELLRWLPSWNFWR